MPRAHPIRTLQDKDTEEVIHVAFPKVRRHRQAFTMVFCSPLLALLCTEGRRHEDDDAMRPVHWRVLLYLLASTEYENRVDRFVTEIAEELGNDRSTVSKALQVLQERDLIHMNPNGSGRPTTIHVHPALCFRGKAGQRAAALHEHWSDVPLPVALSWTPPAP
jgi:DNA-binding MarR family transcriptional regulator